MASPRALVFADVAIEVELLGDVSAGDRSPVWFTFKHGDGHAEAGAPIASVYFYVAELPMLISQISMAIDDFFAERRQQGYRDRYTGLAWPLGDATWVRNGSPSAHGAGDPERLPRLLERMQVWSAALAAMSAEIAEVAAADGSRVL